MSTHAHYKHYVRSAGSEIQQWSYKSSVLSLIHRISNNIMIQMAASWEGCVDWFALVHSKFSQQILAILGLIQEYAFPWVVWPKSLENSQLTHHWHFKLTVHDFHESFTQFSIVWSKNDIDPADNSSVEELPCRLLDPPLATMLSAGTLLEPPPWELRTQPANTQTTPLAAVCTPTLKLDHIITRK